MNISVKSLLAAAACCAAITLIQNARGAASYFWSVASPGSNNWNVAANWTPTGVAGTTDTNIFGNTGTGADAVTPNNVVSADATISSLFYTNATTSGTTYHVTQIPVGVTLTVSSNLTVNGLGSVDAQKTYASMTDAGTLRVAAGTFTVGNNGSSASTALATLDLSGLSNFVYTSSGSVINVASTGANRTGGLLILAAASNNVTAGTINFFSQNTSNGGNGNNSGIKFGAGTNLINVGTFTIVQGKNSGTIQFNTVTGGLRLRGVNGNADDSSRATVTIASRNSTGTGTTTGTLALNGHPVDIKIGTLTIGQDTQSGGNGASGTLQFDTGTVDATTINMAIVGNAAVLSGSGAITVGAGGTLIIGSGGLSMVNQTAGAGGNGTLTINGGVVQANASIRKSTLAGTATINLNTGLLNMGSTTNAIGTIAIPIDNLNLTDASLTLPAVNGRASVVVMNLTGNGTTNTINISAMPGGFPAQYPLITYTTLNGAFNFALGALPGAFQGYLSNNTAALSVDLVVTNSNANTDVWRGNVSGNWDTSTLNWLGASSATNFSNGDNVIFDDSLTGTNNVTLTAALLPGAVGCNNSLTNYVFSGTGKISGSAGLVKQGAGSLTLAETGGDDFTGGMIVNNGTAILDNASSAISGGTTINGGTLQIGNNDGNGALPGGAVTDNGALVFSRTNNVTVGTAIFGAGTLAQNGSGRLALSAVNGYTGNTFANNGVLALTGSGSISNSASVAVSSATLDVSALSQPAMLSGLGLTNSTITVALGGGGSTNIFCASLNTGGATNLVNVTSIPAIASYPIIFTVAQSASAIGGTFNVGVGTLPAGSPAFAANVSPSVDQTAILLTLTGGPVGLRPTVLWTGGDFANQNTNWSDRLNWQLPGAPVAGDNVVFNNTASFALSALSAPGGGWAALLPENINNTVDASFTIASLTFTNDANSYHNTAINSGRTLSITNGLAQGALDTGAAVQHNFVTVSGTNAALALSNTTNNFQVYLGNNNTPGSQATMDMSALDSFSATVSRFLVGASIGNAVNRPSGIVYLARTNSISAAFQTTTIDSGSATANGAIVVADCNGNPGSPSFLYLGQANTISADTIGIGRQKASGHLLFNPTFANIAPYPSVTFQGFSSSRVGNFQVANGAGNSGTTTFSADADLSGGIVSAAINTLTVGRASTNGTGVNPTTGTLSFDAGTISANTAYLGLQTVANAKSGIGTVSVGSNSIIGVVATLAVSGNINLGSAAGGSGGPSTSGTLIITNGNVLAFSIVPGIGSHSTITVAGGRLAVTNAIGSPTAPLENLNLAPFGLDNAATVLSLPVGSLPGISVTNLNLDAQDTTTNIINIESVGPVGSPPLELPLIQYLTMNFISGGTFNIGLGTLPNGYAGYLTNDTANSMVALVLTAALNPRPVASGVSASGTNLVISGTNGFANRPYYVLASTNVALPLVNWDRIATNVFDSNGNFSVTTSISPAIPSRFYTLQVP